MLYAGMTGKHRGGGLSIRFKSRGFESGATGLDERKCKRKPAQLSCWLVGNDEAVCCGTFEISETGVSIRCSDPPVAGQAVRLQFYTPLSAGAVTLEAEVIWSRVEPEGAMGLRFLGMDDRTRSIVREMVRRQGGKKV